jgi:tetratricopeptide (TPR) repeat protein
VSLDHPAVPAIVLRVAEDEPVDSVLWDGLSGFGRNKRNREAIAGLDINTARPPMLWHIAERQFLDGNPAEFDTLHRLMRLEMASQTAPTSTLSFVAVEMSEDPRPDHRDAGFAALRHVVDLDPEPKLKKSTSEALLALHARYGPRADLGGDLERVHEDGLASLTLAHLARRTGAPVITTMLEAHAADRAAAAEEPSTRTGSLVLLGRFVQRLGDWDTAAMLYERALAEETPDTDATWVRDAGFRLGTLASATGDFEKAARAYSIAARYSTNDEKQRRLVDGVPEDVGLAYLWAQVDDAYYRAAEAKEDQAAMTQHARRLLDNPEISVTQFARIAPTLTQCASETEITATFERLYARMSAKLDAGKKRPTQLNNLAWLCARSQRRLDEAALMIEEALRLKPDEPHYVDTLAEVKFRQGDVDAAIRFEEQAISRRPEAAVLKQQLERFKKARATTRPAG